MVDGGDAVMVGLEVCMGDGEVERDKMYLWTRNWSLLPWVWPWLASRDVVVEVGGVPLMSQLGACGRKCLTTPRWLLGGGWSTEFVGG